MGAGKTTIAKLLAKRLNLEHADMDKLVIEKSGRKSDTEIFETDGELAFRELEIAIAKELAKKQNVIISTGGGIVMNKIILDYLNDKGTVIFLKNTFETSQKRVDNGMRPLFQDKKKAKQLYNLRLPLYEYYANIIVETDKKLPKQIVDEIIKYV
jgi:shikimate kinase